MPILIGGNGPNVTWRLAARFADELNLDALMPDAGGGGAAGHPAAVRGDRPRPVHAPGVGPPLGRRRADVRRSPSGRIACSSTRSSASRARSSRGSMACATRPCSTRSSRIARRPACWMPQRHRQPPDVESSMARRLRRPTSGRHLHPIRAQGCVDDRSYTAVVFELWSPDDAFGHLDRYLRSNGFFGADADDLAGVIADVYLGFGLSPTMRRTSSPDPPEPGRPPLLACAIRPDRGPGSVPRPVPRWSLDADLAPDAHAGAIEAVRDFDRGG